MDEKTEVVWRRFGVVVNPEVPASGLDTVRWKSPPVGQRSSSWGGDGCLTSAPRDGYLLRRPKRPNQLGGSVAVLVHAASWVVVAVAVVRGKRSQEMLLVCVVLYEVGGWVLSRKRTWVMGLVWCKKEVAEEGEKSVGNEHQPVLCGAGIGYVDLPECQLLIGEGGVVV